MKNAILKIVLLLSVGWGVYHFFLRSQDDLESKIRQAALENDIIERYYLFKSLDKNFPGQKLIKNSSLSSIFQLKELDNLPLVDKITLHHDGYFDERNIYNGSDYETVETIFRKDFDLNSTSNNEVINYKIIDVKIRDVGFIPKWRRDLECDCLKNIRQNTLSEDQKIVCEKIKLIMVDPSNNKLKYEYINNRWWVIEERGYPDYSPAQVIAYSILKNQVEVVITASNYHNIQELKNAIHQLNFDEKLINTPSLAIVDR